MIWLQNSNEFDERVGLADNGQIASECDCQLDPEDKETGCTFCQCNAGPAM
jgi:hypothetical protein